MDSDHGHDAFLAEEETLFRLIGQGAKLNSSPQQGCEDSVLSGLRFLLAPLSFHYRSRLTR
jgi:hypothetical protein